jgi:hypothetical protein
MKRTIKINQADPVELARAICEALQRERVIPRFVDSYVVANGRQALQVHASLYRDLLGILQREGLIALVLRALEIKRLESLVKTKSKASRASKQENSAFRGKFLSGLSRQMGWGAGEALDFQRDLQLYEELLARNASIKRSRKPFEVANHPFVDRCAFLLDSSFMEQARLAATKALTNIEALAKKLVCADAEEQSGTSRRD